ncbi:MAG: hydantoinase B/oxoprolinase family protein [Proteobacteria bacterium]|nr:hydantoinase B/oxoprolinase family protein [Pseudomonadota bacterium]
MALQEKVLYKAAPRPKDGPGDADPITTEIVRHSLNSAANQMKRSLIRTAFSPVIYEVLDFAVAIYDREVRLLAQAPSLPLFMGTMNFCVEAAVKSVGGEDHLEPGDIILFNDPFGTGSHPQDAALVMPVYYQDDILIGYTTIKGHWLDIGGKEPYSTDTVDVFQEGTIYPGIKLYRRGELVDDIYRTVIANTRLPKMVAGDINAQVVGVRAGAEGLRRVVERFGLDTFNSAVERMYDHGEAVVRSYFENIPDGRYVGRGMMDNDGLDDVSIPFEVVVEVKGSTVRLDYSGAPDARNGPVNCPQPSTVSASRIAISMLAGGNESPCEGHFRPVEVVTRPGSMFHPLTPSPCFLYGWPAMQAIEAIYRAIGEVIPGKVPASSGGDLCALVWWGTREATGEPWADGSPHPCGQGGHANGDGATCLHIAESATRFSPTEVWESKNPWLLEKVELAPDSGGPGKYRGGLGVEMFFQMTEDAYVTATLERTKNAPWGLEGGQEGRANRGALRKEDGSRTPVAKATRLLVKKGWTLELYCGGGGGYGLASERAVADVHNDLREGYITEAHAREFYPHAFEEERVRPAAE